MPGRVIAWGLVFGLLAATVAAAVTSSLFAPKVPLLPSDNSRAAAIVTAAVNADLSTGSFVVHAVETTHRPGYSGTFRYTLIYQAPNRAELINPRSSNRGAIITIGDKIYSNDVNFWHWSLWMD